MICIMLWWNVKIDEHLPVEGLPTKVFTHYWVALYSPLDFSLQRSVGMLNFIQIYILVNAL